jgi:hypothetical protein
VHDYTSKCKVVVEYFLIANIFVVEHLQSPDSPVEIVE